MKYSLHYGNDFVSVDLPEKNIITTIQPKIAPPCQDVEKLLFEKLKNPTAGKPLQQKIREKSAKSVVIVVSDLTRTVPTAALLPPIMTELHQAGILAENISIVIGIGTHRPLTEEEMAKVVGAEIKIRYHVENHDCDSPDLVSIGKLSSGNEFLLNKRVATADFRISVGEVLFHYYAGFAGGRKSILPAVSGRETILRNHALLFHPKSVIGNLEGNPVHQEMLEAADMAELNFIVNDFSDSEKGVISLVTGDHKEAWLAGVREFQKLNAVEITEKADVVFASAGGFPKDINLYQAHKAMEMSSLTLKDNGLLVLFAECREGLGHPVFAQSAKEGLTYEQISDRLKRHFQFGIHKLYYISKLDKRIRILLFSELSAEITKSVFCQKGENPNQLLESIEKSFGEKWRGYVIPQAGIVLPVEKF